LKLTDFCFAHDGLFVVPAEQLSATGLNAAFADALRKRVSEPWVDQFEAALSLYWTRASQLFDDAPDTWFPPRKQNLCVARDLLAARPYSQPFDQASWLFYQSDFDPDTSSVELGAYLFFHNERLGLTRNLTTALVHNLAYFLQRTSAELADFRAGCARCVRPDADAFRALADATEWVPRIYHVALKPPVLDIGEPHGKLEAADLLVPISLQDPMRKLGADGLTVGQQVVERYYAGFAPQQDAKHADALCSWLQDSAPHVLVTAHDGRTLWDPDDAMRVDALRDLVDGIAQAPAESIRDDLEVISERTIRMLAMLKDPDALPQPHELDQHVGTYIHQSRKLIAYTIDHPRMNRLREPSPPYERLMLGARTIHEWGHLAVDAGLVRVPPPQREAFSDRQREVAETLDRIIAAAPPPLRQAAREEAKLLEGHPEQPGTVLTSALMSRMDDFAANLLARRVLSAAEMETYVRANVVSLAQEAQIGPWLKLGRYAYEFQYLRLSRMDDPFGYLLDTTWLRQHYVDLGIASADQIRELVDAVTAVCACYAIDTDAFVDAAAGA